MGTRDNTVRHKMSDEQIIALYFARSEDAIKETDAKYGSYLLAIAENILHDKSTSAECLNDTYIAAWNAIPPQRPKLLRAFLATIMRRTAVSCYRASVRQKRIPPEFFEPLSDFEFMLTDGNDVTDALEAKRLGEIISAFIRTLSERQMYIFMSRYYLARSIDEIAELLSCSRSTVNKEIAAIKCGLKDALEKEGFTV